jgi:hypothetical protein
MVAFAMVTKVQNGRQIQKSSDLGEIWFPSTVEFAYNEVQGTLDLSSL